jgi:hypothetical protein
VINDGIGLVGMVTVQYHDEHGALVREDVFKNRLSNFAVAQIAKILTDGYVKTPSQIKLGTGAPTLPQTTPLTTDIDCWTPANATIRTVDVKTTFLTTYAEYGITYQTNEINDVTYKEALLMDADGNAWAHVIINLFKATATPQTAVVLWKIQVSTP